MTHMVCYHQNQCYKSIYVKMLKSLIFSSIIFLFFASDVQESEKGTVLEKYLKKNSNFYLVTRPSCLISSEFLHKTLHLCKKIKNKKFKCVRFC